jgi:hypothetical protein
MDFMKLIYEAQVAGLTLRADADKLVIRGPRSAEAIVAQLMAHKDEILAIVRTSCHLSPKPRSTPTNLKDTETRRRNSPADEAAPCRRCGSALGWRTADGRVACAECEQKPPAAEVLVLVDTEAGPVWRRYQDICPVEVKPIDGPDPWDDA